MCAVAAFPINYWLVKNRLKHGCMTLPGSDGPAPDFGHRSPESTASGDHHPMKMDHDKVGEMHVHDGGHVMTDALAVEGMASGHDAPSHTHSMAMRELPMGTSLLWIVGTYLMLLGAVWLTGLWVPIKFS